MNKKLALVLAMLLLAFTMSVGSVANNNSAYAQDTNLTDGIQVDSTIDAPDDVVGDGNCDDGSGNCTLRAAIQEANSDPDLSAIEFNVSTTADFTNGGQDGYIFELLSVLPDITESTTIDGFTQAGATANTTVSPAPMDANILIEIDGSALIVSFDPCFTISDTTNVSITGLSIGNCGTDGIFISNSTNVDVIGNYIGVDHTGLVATRNGRTVTTIATGSGVTGSGVDSLTVGGTSPSDRNVIAGNQFADVFLRSTYTGTDADLATTNTNTTIHGNYFGVGSDGTTIIPSGYGPSLGASLYISHSANDQIGGTATGTRNVLASTTGDGIAFANGSRNEVIEGNYIGTDYTGNVPATHPSNSLACDPNGANPCGSFGNIGAGISVSAGTSGGFALSSHDVRIGGTSASARNIISGNAAYATYVFETDGIVLYEGAFNVQIQGNYIGVGQDGSTVVSNSGDGIQIGGTTGGVNNVIIGGTTTSAGNLIANNGKNGVAVISDDSFASIIGNTIFDNSDLGLGLGFDAVTLNDRDDVDSGPNDVLNFPRWIDQSESGGDTTIQFALDVPQGNYRIELYSNTSADASGNGEGEEYVGFVNVVSAGNGVEEFTETFTGVGYTNIAMTATEIVGSNEYGFGATSEFGNQQLPPADLSIVIDLDNPEDVAQGAALDYTVTFTNNGANSFDLGQFDGSGLSPLASSVFVGLLPPDLTYVSQPDPDITCTWFGTGSASLAPFFTNHSDFSILVCAYNAGSYILPSGSSYSITISTTVDVSSSLTFDTFAYTGVSTADVDEGAMSLATAEPDFLDYLLASTANNISLYETAPYVEPTPDPPTVIPPPTVDGVLSFTGSGLAILVQAILLMFTGSIAMLMTRKRSRLVYAK